MPLTLCDMPVESRSLRRAFVNRSNRRGERTDPCTVPVSNWIEAEGSCSTWIVMVELLYIDCRIDTSGTPKPLRIPHRQE